MIQQGQFQMAINAWGAGDIFPHFSFVTDVEQFNRPLSQGPGMSMPMTQQVPGMGAVNFPSLIVQTGEGLDAAAMKSAVSKMAIAFNRVLPIVPLDQRFGDNPVNTAAPITGWSLNSNIWQNSLYTETPVVLLMLEGILRPS